MIPRSECSQCGSHDLWRVAQVYESEVLRHRAGRLVTADSQRTPLAKRLAPPSPRTVAPKEVIVSLGIFFGLFAGMGAGAIAYNEALRDLTDEARFWAALGTGLSVALVVGFVLAKLVYETTYTHAKPYNDAVYRPLRAVYDRLVICLSCGAVAERH